MGFYVKNVSVPACCLSCYKRGLAQVLGCTCGDENLDSDRADGCMLVKFPDNHGGLIDRDVLWRDISDESWSNPYFRGTARDVVSSVIRGQRVILEKE